MRCKNCGWPNEDGAERCVKCNDLLYYGKSEPSSPVLAPPPFDAGTVMANPMERPDMEYPAQPVLHTVDDHPEANADFNTPLDNRCPECGYPANATATKCPICQTELTPSLNATDGKEEKEEKASGETCTLRRIPWTGENRTYETESFSGEFVTLNRDNTDPGNKTISSDEQARLSCEDGEWFIENPDGLPTTLFRIDGKLKLEDGDIIVLGNRMFEFRK